MSVMIAPGTQPSMSFIFGSFRISELDAEFDADGFDGTTGGTGGTSDVRKSKNTNKIKRRKSKDLRRR